MKQFLGITSWPWYFAAMAAAGAGMLFMPDGPWWRECGAFVCIAAYSRLRERDDAA